jgi:hypothetical protein
MPKKAHGMTVRNMLLLAAAFAIPTEPSPLLDNPSFWVTLNFPDYARFFDQHHTQKQPASKFVNQTYFTEGKTQIYEVPQITPRGHQ